jgi:hypothetical protein
MAMAGLITERMRRIALNLSKDTGLNPPSLMSIPTCIINHLSLIKYIINVVILPQSTDPLPKTVRTTTQSERIIHQMRTKC